MSLQRAFAGEAQFISRLTRLLCEGTNDGFLIVSCGPDYFMQFVRNKTMYMRTEEVPIPDHIFWNVADNETLPHHRHLSEIQIAQIQRLGFVYPCSPHPVYQFYSTGFVRVIEHPTQRDVETMAHLGCEIFTNTLHCVQLDRLRFELRLEGYHA